MCLFLVLFVLSPVLTARISNSEDCNGLHSFRCNDGTCISQDEVCNGRRNCIDGADEMNCFSDTQGTFLDEPDYLHRTKRQTGCRRNQWRCRDGSCIPFDGKCDGSKDCADGSDETHALCRNTRCQSNWFRCTYGACVDGTAACNGLTDCADQSDELQPRCFNQTDEIRGRFKCQDGSFIIKSNKCDGVANCPDGSDETLRACAATTCQSNLFQCAYGACVDQDSNCNGNVECADGSDEDDELCNRIGAATTTTTTTIKPPATGNCKLPAYPAHGSYLVSGQASARPGETFDTVYLNFSCESGYGLVGKGGVYCYGGFWSEEPPLCVRFCKLNPHPSVEYMCQVPESNGGTRACNEYEPSGTHVSPSCRAPNYYTSQILSSMRCVEGSWDYVATCQPECGKETPSGLILISGGRISEKGEFPWHVGIYRKNVQPYMQICGGSIISSALVISAAHCFWNDFEKLQPASRYAVAAGKLYRPWNEAHDVDAQTTDVTDIKVPIRFRGVQTNFQDDIALLVLAIAFKYETYVRPICIDFDTQFDKRQLSVGNLGKVAGWGLVAENGGASQVLKVVDLPYVDINTCYSEAPPSFREFITSDKICAGYTNGTALCQGDSGGGLAFPETEKGTKRYYLRGIVSTAPKSDNNCNVYAMTTFTQILSHEHFIKENFARTL